MPVCPPIPSQSSRTTQTLKDKRDAVKGMLAAIRKAVAVDVADPSIGATLAVNQYGKSAGLKLDSEKEHGAAYAKYFSSADTKEHGYLWVDPEFRSPVPIFREA